MKKDFTEIVCILDRSGSMGTVRNDAIHGFNTFLADQKKVPGTAKLTIVMFDDQYEVPVNGCDIQHVEALNEKTYVPRGMTALHDAMGKAIDDLGARLAKTPEHERPERVIIVTLTDGQENHSKEFTGSMVKEKIEHQTNKYNWTFMFLAAGQDAILTASNLGIAKGFTANYVNDSRGLNFAYSAVSSAVGSFRKCGLVDSDWKANLEPDDPNEKKQEKK